MSWQYGHVPKSFKFIKFLFHLPNFLKLAWRLFRDSRVPIYRKSILVTFATFAAAYILIPTDLIPDWLPLVGQIDDSIPIIILLPGVYFFIKTSPKEIVREHVERIDQGM